MKTFYLSLFLALAPALFSACQPPDTNSKINLSSQDVGPNFNPLHNLNSEEEEQLLPNELFKAIYNKSTADFLQQIIDKNSEYLLELNSEGDTPLGFAIKVNFIEEAVHILSQMDPDHYLHQNNSGESYLYLASQKGSVKLVIFLSTLFYDRQQGSFDYEFSDLDLKTNQGERALHVAKSSAVAEALHAEYRKGLLEYPLRKFQFLQNNEGQTFLHTAVRDQNEDLLRWGLKETCSQSEDFWTFLWEGAQSLSSQINIDFDYLLNTKDNQDLTALNLAAKNSYLEGIDILSSCPWSDYLIKDSEGNTPLQNFLLSLDPLKDNQSQEVKSIFLRLVEKRSLLSFNSFSKNINSTNNKGENSLHISAHLNDPFFYNKLKIHGNKEVENNEGKTAREIFENHQKSIRLY